MTPDYERRMLGIAKANGWKPTRCEKTRHRSEAHAKRALNNMLTWGKTTDRTSGILLQNLHLLRAYPCDVCTFWHVGRDWTGQFTEGIDEADVQENPTA